MPELRHRVSCLELLEGYLDTEGVAYTIDEHPPRYTAQELAQVEHVSGRLIAKAVMVAADGTPVMVVMPGVAKVDLGAVRKALGADEIRLAAEEEFDHLFIDCEVGAIHRSGISTACLCARTRRWHVTR